jgi:fucose permease
MQHDISGEELPAAGAQAAVKPPLSLVVITFANMSLLGFLNSMRGVSFPLIKNGFNVSYSNMGLMSVMASFAAVCFCVVAGIYMNSFGLKRTVVTGFFIMMMAVGSFYFASVFWLTVCIYILFQSGYSFFEIGLNGPGVRVFTVKSGLMLNLLHFFYGVGAIGGPRFMGFMVDRASMRWQDVYPLTLVPLVIMLVITLTIRYPHAEKPSAAREQPSFWSALKDPMVWLFGSILGVSGAIEGCSISWSGLYLYDVYGLDPSTTGAAFVSVFFALYTVSRFLSGFVIEKTGYLRSIIVSSAVVFALFVTAFALGRSGIYLLPVVGFFIALMWPTILAISVGVFRERAQTVSSAMISIGLVISGTIQFGFGLSNRLLGAAWAYRSCIFYSFILGTLLVLLARRIKMSGAVVR